MSSVVISGDTSGAITLAAPTTAGTNTITLPAATGTMGLTLSQIGMKNRIINGGMVLDQRNAGASGTGTVYTVDRWQYAASQASKITWQQNAGSVTPPVGFTNYLGFTSSSAYSVLAGDYFATLQPIEGFNTADLAWGTVNAKTVTLSFWAYSSLTGTFGGSLRNSAANRSYPFSYSIPVANTWTQISITIAGDTTGTWVGATNGIGINLAFGLGVGSTASGTAGSWSANNYLSATGATSVVGTNGATFYITGVQLEVGSQATTFDFRSYGTELALCQRYYTFINGVSGNWSSGTSASYFAPLSCPMRATPSLAYTGTINGQSQGVNTYTSTTQPSAINIFGAATGNGLANNKIDFAITGFTGAGTLNTASILYGQTITVSAEL